jgi:thymidylate kinase
MTKRGLLICFTGIDGSGKTTQAERLLAWLQSRGIKSTYVWSRGEVLAIRRVMLILGRRILGASEHRIVADKALYREYQFKKSKLLRNPFVRGMWSAMVRLEHLIQINRDIRGSIRAGNVVVCDRYLWDSTVDLAALNNKKPEWLLNRVNKFMWRLIPRPTLTFLLDIPADEALKRKDDIPSSEYVYSRIEHYRHLAKNCRIILIDGCGNIATIQNKITDTVGSYI